MRKIKLLFAWLNYELSYWTHNNKPEYQYQLWFKYQELKTEAENKIVNYTHTLTKPELNGRNTK